MPSRQVSKHRAAAYKSQDGRCFWCGGGMLWYHETKGKNHPLRCTAEHLHPRNHGGRDTRANIVAACFQCNTARKDHPLEIWLPRVKFRLKQSGNPQHYDVILSFLKARGIDLVVGPTSQEPPTSEPRPSAP